MEERDRARGVIQRRFDLKAEPPDPAKETPVTPPEVASAAAPPPPILRGPSDVELRERQMRWVEARLRFEAKLKSGDASVGPK